jgi:phage I-like protein
MNTLLLNRDFKLPDDGWFHVVPLGEYPHRQGKVVQVLDNKATEAIVTAFKLESSKENYPGILVDFDHFSSVATQSSKAAGWITELQNRENGVWANIRWTEEGSTAVKGGSYRLVSPTWTMDQCETVKNYTLKNKLDPKFFPSAERWPLVRPLKLHSLALTNEPNLGGMVPLTNRNASDDAAATPNTQPQRRNDMENLKKALGLAADATEEQAIAEVTKIKNRATEAESNASKLTEENKVLLNSQVDADLLKYANRIKPESKDALKAQLLSNRSGTIALLESLADIQVHQPLHNRAESKTPTEEKKEDKPAAPRDEVAIWNAQFKK